MPELANLPRRAALWALAMCAALLALVVPLSPVPQASATAGAAGTAIGAATACHHVHGPFRVRGAYMITGHGTRYIPYGINLTNLREGHGSYAKAISAGEAEEDAALAWCANTVRLFAAQEQLIVNGKVNQAYLAALTAEVSHAEHDGLAVVVADLQTARFQPVMPVLRTMLTWRALSRQFGADPQVIFDVFNEPGSIHERGKAWQVWRNGGQVHGRRVYGMEQTAGVIRRQGGRNLLWVEGPHRAGTLTGVRRWHLRHAGPVAYAVHRPPAPHTWASWTRDFGYLVGRYPVVDGEWADYARAHANWACWKNGPTAVSRFLRYLAARDIGLIGYNLARPRLLESASLTDPNRFRPNWACVNGLNEGAGHRLMSWFHRRNGESSAVPSPG